MVKDFYFQKRHSSRIARHYFRTNIPDKVVVEKSKISYAQYFIIPTILTFVGVQYFKQSNHNPIFLLFIVLGGLFSFGLNIFLTRKFRKNPEIILNNKGITFSNTRTIFWKEILYYRLQEKHSVLKIYVKCESEEFYKEFTNLPISKVKLRLLINSFHKKFCKSSKSIHRVLVKDVHTLEPVNLDKYLGNNIL
ncbi:hypothetical protein [Chryseobacterium foetidum]|uniref:hypothetical protein n=1 Tax=Chryseobacterium foetidum TaxID=2951057 RepID=UPI0021C8E75F|nr:hypothetical protein [Chryseobacterium foetidum]